MFAIHNSGGLGCIIIQIIMYIAYELIMLYLMMSDQWFLQSTIPCRDSKIQLDHQLNKNPSLASPSSHCSLSKIRQATRFEQGGSRGGWRQDFESSGQGQGLPAAEVTPLWASQLTLSRMERSSRGGARLAVLERMSDKTVSDQM